MEGYRSCSRKNQARDNPEECSPYNALGTSPSIRTGNTWEQGFGIFRDDAAIVLTQGSFGTMSRPTSKQCRELEKLNILNAVEGTSWQPSGT